MIGLSGETFNLIVSDQFQRLRDGDRFFYLNELDHLKVLAPDLEDTSLSAVIRDNKPESLIIQDNAFILPYENKLVGTDLAEMLFGSNQDEHSGAYGVNSDLHFDVQGKVIHDFILQLVYE